MDLDFVQSSLDFLQPGLEFLQSGLEFVPCGVGGPTPAAFWSRRERGDRARTTGGPRGSSRMGITKWPGGRREASRAVRAGACLAVRGRRVAAVACPGRLRALGRGLRAPCA